MGFVSTEWLSLCTVFEVVKFRKPSQRSSSKSSKKAIAQERPVADCLPAASCTPRGDRLPRLGDLSTAKPDEPVEPEPHQFLVNVKKTLSGSSTQNSRSLDRHRKRYKNGSFASLTDRKSIRRIIRTYTSETISVLKGQKANYDLVQQSQAPLPNMTSHPSPPRGRRNRCALYSSLIQKMVLRDKREARFLPDDLLHDLICKKAVLTALEREKSKFTTNIPKLAEFICTRARKLFAALVWNESTAAIEHFYRCKLDDKSLPIEIKIDSQDDVIEAFESSLGRLTAIDDHPFNDEAWSDKSMEGFRDDAQWCFLIPTFEAHKFRYHFDERTRMPFMNADHLSQKESNFSVVEKWELHRNHLKLGRFTGVNLRADGHPSVAVKELKKMGLDDETFKEVAEKEARALEMMRDMKHPHLIKAIAYYTKGKKHYVMFPWATLGNLREFWKKDPPKLNKDYMRWAFRQMCGLADAVQRLHHFNTEKFWRHGDLKPENILCFDSDENGKDPCIFVIADVGLTQVHEKMTELRIDATRTNQGTVMYEPPEAELATTSPRSRRYDIWSMGCIYLEFIVWLLYGSKELERFRSDLISLGGTTRFYAVEDSHRKTVRLNNGVQKWIDWIRKDTRCPEDTALRQLVELVVLRLLVADVSKPRTTRRKDSVLHQGDSLALPDLSRPPRPHIVRTSTTSTSLDSLEVSPKESRASAEEMHEEMEQILEDATRHPSSCIDWIKWSNAKHEGPRQFGDRLNPSDAGAALRNYPENEYKTFTPLDDSWEYTPDTETAQMVFNDTISRSEFSRIARSSKLCFQCGSLDLWQSRQVFLRDVEIMKKDSDSCDLCRLLYRCVEHTFVEGKGDFKFLKAGSAVTYERNPSNALLSLYTLPRTISLAAHSATSSNIQAGFPELPAAGSPTHIKIIKEWIRSCDQNHQCYPRRGNFLPTRVIDVRDPDSTTVRLFCDIKEDTVPGRYLTLSHQWGLAAQHAKFCTYTSNIDRFQQGIEVAQLPQTFRDAVTITRNLGLRYLWIDSLCIVQDDPGDWDKESKRMEQVFSSAYATIAASCAGGTNDGFLRARPERQYVTINNVDKEPYFVCDAIDDFETDVEQSSLNKRGWVLQERALSRRTMFFAEKQTYWECGEGVRCETLTKMNNRKASFLGDANFPHSVETHVKGMKISLFQSLYERYSNLQLTYSVDRPIAIKGLERRLLRTLKTIGGFGVFQCYLHRCLLWQRSGEKMSPIESFRSEKVPSWSWMAYDGGIKYMEIPFGEVIWSDEIISPFKGSEEIVTGREPPGMELWSYDFILSSSSLASERFILDEPSRERTGPMRCVIVGTRKTAVSEDSKVYYVLLVEPASGKQFLMYRRVGVAVIESNDILMYSKKRLCLG